MSSSSGTSQKALEPEDTAHVHYVIPGRRLFDFESGLKQLPVPEVKDSIQMYSTALRPLLSDAAELEEYNKLVEEFLAPSSGVWKLQELLLERAKTAAAHTDYPFCSWLEEWWEKYAYLSWPEPLPMNVNFFGAVNQPKGWFEQIPTAAASLVAVLKFRQLIVKGDLSPDALDGGGKHPLSSFQYLRMFASTRLPSETCDTFHSPPHPVDYIAVAARGFWFKLRVLDSEGSPLPGEELLEGLMFIDEMSASLVKQGVRPQPVGLLTALHRHAWARARAELLAVPSLAVAITDIEHALFNVALSDRTPTTARERMLAAELGDTQLGDYWFDKSFTLFFFKNGAVCFGGEHAHADAPVPARMIHAMGLRLRHDDDLPRLIKRYHDIKFPSATHATLIEFPHLPLLDQHLKAAAEQMQKLVELNEIDVLEHPGINRNVLKKLQISPDAFFQMAMQLAYFRDQGTSTATYETASTRAFFHGRTETIRPLSVESAAWVRAMSDPHTTVAERQELLRKATHTHVSYTRAASFGKGCDRHLFGLKIIALENGLPVPPLLLHPLFARGTDFGLSTSNMSDTDAGIPGFGAPGPNCYGVCYNIGHIQLEANISSSRACPTKSASGFRRHIFSALEDLLALLTPATPSSHSKQSSSL